MGRPIERKNFGRLGVICGVIGCSAMLLVFFSLYYTRTQWSIMETQHDGKSVLVGLVLVMLPFVGTVVAFLAGCGGAVLGVVGLSRKRVSKTASLAGLVLAGIALGIAVLCVLGMGSFRQG